MFRRRPFVPMLLVLSLSLAGCAAAAARPAPAKAVDARLIDAGTRFSFDLFHALQAEKPAENLFISPASVQMVLSLTYNGARGETQQAMAKALSLNQMAVADVNRETGALRTVLANPDPKVELSIANAIWYKQGYKLNKEFAAISKEHYKADIEAADFGTPGAEKRINQWVDKATKGKIPRVIEDTSKDDRMYLVNAIYFKGQWQDPFDAHNTRNQPFKQLDGTARDVPMMIRGGHYRYLKGDNFQAAALPYGEGRLSLYLIVPNAGVPFDQFVSQLTAERWATWRGQFSSHEGSVSMPKVKLTYHADLKPAMRQLGMGIAFDPNAADFGSLFTGLQEPLYIRMILHDTALEINEQGTEAAAVTVVGVKAGSAPPPRDRFSLVADHPYMIAICDDVTGAILFMGAIVNP